MYTTCSELIVFMYWTRKSMKNLSPYCGLVDVRIRASDKDLPVQFNGKLYSFWNGKTWKIRRFELSTANVAVFKHEKHSKTKTSLILLLTECLLWIWCFKKVIYALVYLVKEDPIFFLAQHYSIPIFLSKFLLSLFTFIKQIYLLCRLY